MSFEVVCCHFGDGEENNFILNVAWKFIKAFRPCDVPCFVIMTFIFSQKVCRNSSRMLLKRRMKRLIIPTIAWAFIYLPTLWISHTIEICDVLYWMKALLLQLFFGHVYNETMWFQANIIWLTLVFYFLYKLFKKRMETKRLFWMLLTLIIASQYTGMNYYLIKCMPEYVRYNIRKINRNATICSYRFGMENGNSLEKNVVCDNGMLFYPSFNRMCF